MWNQRLRSRCPPGADPARAARAEARRTNPLDLLYLSSDESEDEGDTVPCNAGEGFGFTFSQAPGSPMDADETTEVNDSPSKLTFNLGTGGTSPGNARQRCRPGGSSVRSGKQSPRVVGRQTEANSPPPQTEANSPPRSPARATPDPESPPPFDFFGGDNTWPRSGSFRNRSGSGKGTAGTTTRRSDTTPAPDTKQTQQTPPPPDSNQTKSSPSATPFGASAFAPGGFSPFGFGKKSTPPPFAGFGSFGGKERGGNDYDETGAPPPLPVSPPTPPPPFSPVPRAAAGATASSSQTEKIEAGMSNLSFAVGSGGSNGGGRGKTSDNRRGRGSKPRGGASPGSSPRGTARGTDARTTFRTDAFDPYATHPSPGTTKRSTSPSIDVLRESIGRVNLGRGAEELRASRNSEPVPETPKFPSFFPTDTSGNASWNASSGNTSGNTSGATAFQFTPPPPAASSTSSFSNFGAGVGGAKTNGAPFAAVPPAPGLFTPGAVDSKANSGGKKKPQGRTPKKKTQPAHSPPRSPTAAAFERVPPSIFQKEEKEASPLRSPVRRALRPGKPSSPTAFGTGNVDDADSPMDVLRESIGRVNLGRDDDSSTRRNSGASAGANPNVSFTFVSEATRLKDLGNAAFKAGQYNVASGHYDGALERMGREFLVGAVPGELLDACLVDGVEARKDGFSEIPETVKFVKCGRDAAVCYANRAAARLMSVSDKPGTRGSADAGDTAETEKTRSALAAAADIRAALRDCRAALAADPTFRRARLRAGTCLMRLGAFADARCEFMLAAEGGSGDATSREATRLAEDAARGAALVADLTLVNGGALSALRKHLVDGAGVGSLRVKARVFRAAGGDEDRSWFDFPDRNDTETRSGLKNTNACRGGSHVSAKTTSQVARSVLRLTKDLSHVAPHCAAVAEAKARALVWEGRFTDACAVADAEGLGGTEDRVKAGGGSSSRNTSGNASENTSRGAEPSFGCQQTLSAFRFQTGGENWRAFVRVAARFAAGDLAGATRAIAGATPPKEDRKVGPPEKSENSSGERVMNDDVSFVQAWRVTQALAVDEHVAFTALAKIAAAAHLLRQEGNVAFKGKDFGKATEKYTSALAAVAPTPGCEIAGAFAAVCLCNRAASAHASGAVTDALADCGRALVCNPTRLKSLSRRAQLRFETRLYAGACEDLQRLLTTLTLEATLVGVHKTDNARFMRVSLQDSGSGTETADNSSTAYKTFRDAVIVRLRDARRESASLPALVVDHLSVLGLRNFPAGVSQIDDGDVKKAYRKLALKHHPDKSVVGLPPWIDQSAVRKDADSVFKLVGEANAALCDSRKRAEYFANDRKATIRHGGGGRDDFGFGGSTFARDASRYGGRSGGSSGHGHGHQGWTGRESDTTGGGSGGESWGDWFSDANRARGRGAYKQRPKSGYKT